MIVSHEFGPGAGGARGGERRCTLTLTPGGEMQLLGALARSVALPFASEGGTWEEVERLETSEGTVTIRLDRKPGPPALDHQQWLRSKGVPAAPRGRQAKRRVTKAQASTRVSQVAALAGDWAAEYDKAIHRYLPMAERLLQP